MAIYLVCKKLKDKFLIRLNKHTVSNKNKSGVTYMKTVTVVKNQILN